MSAGIHSLCDRCRWGAKAAHRGQCGCPGIKFRDIEVYAALLGYNTDKDLGRFYYEQSCRAQLPAYGLESDTKATEAAIMVFAADSLKTCKRFVARATGEADEWKLYRNFGGRKI